MRVFSRRSFQIPASVKEQREARLGVRTPGFPNTAPEQMCTPGQVTQVPSSIICNMKEFDSSSTKCFSDSFFLPRKKSSTVYYLEKSYGRCVKEVLIPLTFTLSEKGGPSTNHSVLLSTNSCNHHLPVSRVPRKAISWVQCMEILCYKGGMQAPPTLTAAHLPARRQSCTLCFCSQAESISGQAAALPPRENLETQMFRLPVSIYSPPGNRLAKQTPEFKPGVWGRGRNIMSHYTIKISLYIPAVSVGPNWGFIS